MFSKYRINFALTVFSYLFVDTTAVCILEGFGHQAGMFLADKMLKELGKEKASQAYKVLLIFSY